ncbi:MAG: alpha-amylase/4-alpha-glucanotransferase domain-containing protein [Planctomycetota bacterium]
MISPRIQLCLVLHNHQPVGNFDNVFEAAYQDSYLPFLEVFEPFEHLNISLHTSGPLMKWLDERHPEYLDRLAQLVAHGRVEIVGGAFYEPIMAMIPRRDRVGQISRFSDWLTRRLQAQVGGMWIPERVWESNMASDIAEAGIRYTVLDDFHFRRAGLTDDQLDGSFIVEDEGSTLRVFPGSEQLRYLIPFAEPSATIEHCRTIADRRPGSVIVFGDDGEKFGTWPDTKAHVYERGWLQSFFQALTDNRDWLKTSTLAEAVQSSAPRGKIYLPDASYREMTEWAQPVTKQREFDSLSHEMENDGRWSKIMPFVSGGYWRNFKVKYPETNYMYSRMMYVSGLLEQAKAIVPDSELLAKARDHLYQGQCNCSYWHGAFGGIYLPHLRNAVYQHLLAAENTLNEATGRPANWIEATASDYDFDGRQEIRLANEQVSAWISASRGGQIYELDVHDLQHNLGATMMRRPEVYHQKVLAGQNQGDDGTSSIHDRVVFKQEGLDKCLQYDRRLRTSLIDHFWDSQVEVRSIADNEAEELGDFADGQYSARIRRNPDRIQVVLQRDGNAAGLPLKMTKGITLAQASNELEIAYMIEGLPADRELHFGVEFNFAGLPDGQDDRFFSDATGNNLGQLGNTLNLSETAFLALTDQWLGIKIGLEMEQTGGIWAFPVQSVSQSESGFELVHQAVSVQPHWIVRGDQNGRWSTRIRLSLAMAGNDNQISEDDMITANG